MSSPDGSPVPLRRGWNMWPSYLCWWNWRWWVISLRVAVREDNFLWLSQLIGRGQDSDTIPGGPEDVLTGFWYNSGYIMLSGCVFHLLCNTGLFQKVEICSLIYKKHISMITKMCACSHYVDNFQLATDELKCDDTDLCAVEFFTWHRVICVLQEPSCYCLVRLWFRSCILSNMVFLGDCLFSL